MSEGVASGGANVITVRESSTSDEDRAVSSTLDMQSTSMSLVSEPEAEGIACSLSLRHLTDLRERYRVPSELTFRLPRDNERACTELGPG